VIAAYILIQTEPGTAAIVATALRDLPGVSEAAATSSAQAADVHGLLAHRNALQSFTGRRAVTRRAGDVSGPCWQG